MTLTAESVSACKAFYCWLRNHKEAPGVRGEFMNCFENPTIQTKRLVHCKLGQEWQYLSLLNLILPVYTDMKIVLSFFWGGVFINWGPRNRHVFTHFQKIYTLVYDRVHNNFKQERGISSTDTRFFTPSNYQAVNLCWNYCNIHFVT